MPKISSTTSAIGVLTLILQGQATLHHVSLQIHHLELALQDLGEHVVQGPLGTVPGVDQLGPVLAEVLLHIDLVLLATGVEDCWHWLGDVQDP
eukprot:8516379-Heterocapsa_arctica.AAC.1